MSSGTIGALIDQLERDARRLDNTLSQISGALAAGAGSPNPGELTPDQAFAISSILAVVGLHGGEILTRDLELTAAREAGA